MDLRRLDEIAAAATVSAIEADVAGWWCKAAPDLPFRRCNVALPPADAADDPERFRAGLAAVRDWYHELGLRLIVQVSSAVPGWERVDGWLAAEALAVEAPVQVMTGPFTDTAAAEHPRVTVMAGIDGAWAAAYGALFGGSATEIARTEAYGRMLAAHGGRGLAATCRIEGRTVGVGFGVLDDGWMGVFGMVTAEDRRRQGVAGDVLVALIRAAHRRGVDRSYLQVEPDNLVAIRLYEGLDFRVSHRYHYRSEGADPGQGC